ncbi:BTAD domain-containing putative transcriptional regulator [Parafrankia sp. BMG5.11]|uniref:AfsR/SARP family transcriptional regulator n=1 Tax=Parafrankia sp. BMG5.11 TaxID=222540 RepID=UPI001FB3A431|nr:BTAD domain-containing putative transcriptional regulator [Parafrankia sp. BMG5.11]
MRVRLLGPVDVVDAAGLPIAIGSPTQRLLLAILGSRVGDVVPPARLVDAVWGESPPPSAEATLRSYISRLRRVLGDALPTHPGGWSLRLAPEQVDIAVFERLLRLSGQVQDASARLAALDDALALWRGPAFGELTDDPALRPVAVRLGEARGAARESRAALLLAVGRPAEAVGAAEELLAEYPWREGAWGTLLGALSGSGRAVEAADAYRRAHAALAEVGLEPGPALRAAQAVALSTAAPTAAPTVVPTAAPVAAPAPERAEPTGSAPAGPAGASGVAGVAGSGRRRRPRRPVTSLLGREADTAAVCDLLASARLVTMFGPGGVGKTRLALYLADRLADRFPHGVLMVELATVADPTAVPAFVADALGMRGADGDAGAALEAAAELDALVILDNCEHVVAAAAAVASALVENGRGVRVLATSRELLGVDGEHCWPVRPLRVDGPDAPAHALFWDRVRAACPAPVPGAGPASDGDLEAADRIVRRLDGLPLGIEMAAARSGTMSLPELADRLEDHLGLLRDVRRVGTPRHRTLADVVGWSVSLLDAPHRAMLRTMGAFAGPVSPVDVAALAGLPEPEALDLLDALVARSLVVVDPSRVPARYSLLEIIREYARRQLGASDAVLRQEHARYILAEVRAADAVLRTPREAAGHSRITDLMVEARAAQTWALREDPPLAVEIAAGMHVFAMTRLRVEPLHAAVELVRSLGLHPPPGGEPHRLADLVSDLAAGLPPGVTAGAAATTLATAACWYVSAGELELAVACAQRGRLIAGDAPERRFPLELLSDTASYQGRIGEAVDHGWELVAAARSCADPHAEVAGLLNVAIAHAYAGHAEDGRAALSQAPAGPLAPSELGWLAYGEAELILDRDPDRCLRLLDRAVALADSVDNPYLGGVARVSAVSVRARCGDPQQAVEAFAQVLRHWRDQYALTHLLTTLRNLVVLFQRLGRPRPAARLLGAVTSQAVKPSYGAEAAMLAGADSWVDDALGFAAATAERAAGATRTVIAATETALDDLADITAEIRGG